MKRLFIVFIISVLALSCQNIEKPEKPEDLIDKEVMVEILVDTYLSNAVRSKTYQEMKDKNIRLEKYINEKYAIDSLQFAKSNSFYSADMDGYLLMLKKVEEKLHKLKNEEEEEPMKELDSELDKNKDPEESRE